MAQTATPPGGYLDEAPSPNGHGLLLTHGAGSNASAPLVVALAAAFNAAGVTVLRYDLPYRQARPRGSPYPAQAAADRAGLRDAVVWLRQRLGGRIFMGGHSYGGRQSTMLATAEPGLADGLLLTSYPLHPPGRPDKLRTEHFGQLATAAFFVQGTRDAFGTVDEVRKALALLAGPHELMVIDGVGHDLGGKASAQKVAARVAEAFGLFVHL
jgi:predicted alpha/beta-hydrolase family hydrolase